jgi:acyl carrier protein
MIESQLKEIVSKQFGVVPDSINLSTRLVDDFGADSLDIIEMSMTIEKHFQISIEDSDLDHAVTIQSLIDLVHKKTARI